MSKKIFERPTNKEVKIICLQCKLISKHFMTNQEIFMKQKIKQICQKCKGFNIHTLEDEKIILNYKEMDMLHDLQYMMEDSTWETLKLSQMDVIFKNLLRKIEKIILDEVI